MKDFAVSANLLKVSKYLLNSRFENQQKRCYELPKCSKILKSHDEETQLEHQHFLIMLKSIWNANDILRTICATQTWFSYALSYFERQKVVKI